MAADFASAQAAMPAPMFSNFQQPQYQQLYYGSQHTPINSANATPSNLSPTSPRHHSHLSIPVQLRPQKSPLYIPAALRPTEKPLRNSPPKDKKAGTESPDSVKALPKHLRTDSLGSSINRIVSAEWNDEPLGEVTGPPTRNHWKVSILHFAVFFNIIFKTLACTERGQVRTVPNKPAHGPTVACIHRQHLRQDPQMWR